MSGHLHDTVTLNNGVKMPLLGLGVWQVEDGSVVANTVASALSIGIRSIDTAAAYRNEIGVGQAIAASGVPRDQLFITTKVWNADQGYESTLRACADSLKKLGLESIDLYLIHWPVQGKYLETWRAMEKLVRDGFVRAIGVSNFQVHHLQDVLTASDVVPAVNQVEFHPLLTQQTLRSFCTTNGIQLEAWSPLMQGNLDHPVLRELSATYGKSAAQILIRWDIQHNVVTIPKSVRAARIQENTDVFDFTLSAADMARLDSMNEDKRFGPDPDNFNF